MSDTINENPTLNEAPPRPLVRADEGRWIGGVCAGLSRYFDVNPLVYRIAFAALALAGGTGLLLYIAAYLVIPGERDGESVAVEALRRHRNHPWLLLGVSFLAFCAVAALSQARFWPGTGNLWLAATLAGGALIWWHVSNRDRTPHPEAPAAPNAASTESTQVVPPAPPPRPRKRPSLFAPALGALLAAAGVFGLLAVLNVYDVDLAVALAAGVAIIGVGIAAGAITQRRVGGLVFLGVIMLVAFGIAAATPVSVSAGAGQKTERPTTLTALQPKYELGVGDLGVDLTAVTFPAGTRSVDANVGVGHLLITVPQGVAVKIDAQAGVGEVDVLGARDDGIDAQRSVSVPGSTANAPVLDLEADVGLGHIEVLRG